MEKYMSVSENMKEFLDNLKRVNLKIDNEVHQKNENNYRTRTINYG
jgi:protein involved in ribonucleotide reduction